ncbi:MULTISPECIES: TetR family transcriptional regulator C-terminal domain-containing protein [unclassified Streptomyces]|uniref:TetR/AcrR family transcriptional regulator n=1 Tax=unclassified Streptomyces TaxID=2593676 RepID=UPI000DC7EA7F|nr:MULTISPECIES: TetR family transcriptional regulator C-terminal domain-containing protein [unclassified Streptomyces]AWZ09275.1 TetR family transcriptional regulator [Streptomyces sp. ICC4]AWZ14513.1 TetR family transcriptional regulator [Streptomyces sp. ICC1]
MSDRRTEILRAATRVIARRGVRGLRVGELAAEAGVSTSLIYYHFTDRAGILRRTLEFISDRAERYTAEREAGADGGESPRDELTQVLLLELQDTPEVRENSTAWGELRASAVFDPDLREEVAKATHSWVHEISYLLAQARPVGTAPEHAAAAERLTALLEGLSVRWLSGSLPLEHARRLLSDAITAELDA